MPRSTTAWLMASVSVAFSAISPIHINKRLIALNIGFFGLGVFSWLFVFQEDFLLQDKLKLGVQLFFIRGAHDGRAEAFERRELAGVHVKRDEMYGKAGMLLFGQLLEPGQDRVGRRPGGVDTVSNDEDMFAGER